MLFRVAGHRIHGGLGSPLPLLQEERWRPERFVHGVFETFQCRGALAAVAADSSEDDHERTGDIVSNGRKLCKGIRLSQFSEADFAGSVQSGSSLPVPLQLATQFSGVREDDDAGGQVQAEACPAPDFFVTHSWSDDSASKYEALEAVAARFKNEFGREPVFWM